MYPRTTFYKFKFVGRVDGSFLYLGETVKWVNEDDRGHPIASIPGQGTNDKELSSSPIPPGGSWSHTFRKTGEYPYFCYIHYVMMGAVIVEDTDQTSPEKTE